MAFLCILLFLTSFVFSSLGEVHQVRDDLKEHSYTPQHLSHRAHAPHRSRDHRDPDHLLTEVGSTSVGSGINDTVIQHFLNPTFTPVSKPCEENRAMMNAIRAILELAFFESSGKKYPLPDRYLNCIANDDEELRRSLQAFNDQGAVNIVTLTHGASCRS